MQKFAGRQQELQVLAERGRSAIAGHGNCVLISGDAGIGKSVLVQQFLRQIDGESTVILVGSCYDLSVTPPFGPWIDAFSRYPQERELPPLPESLLNAVRQSSQNDQYDLKDSFIEFMLDLAVETSVVVVLEDLHWADRSSLDLLRMVARKISSHSVLVVATYRPDEPEAASELATLLHLIVRETNTTRIDLRPLDDIELNEFILQRLDLSGPGLQHLHRYLSRWGDGNPLYTEEILRELELRGLVEGNQLATLEDVPVPRLIQQIVSRRLDFISPLAKRMLQYAALLGQIVHTVDLEDLLGKQSFDETLDEGLSSRLLEEHERGQTLRFRHALVRQAIHDLTPHSLRRQIHREIATLLIHRDDPDPDAVAYHLKAAGDSQYADWLFRAGERAERQFAWVEAAQRYLEALEALKQRSSSLVHVADPLLRAGIVLRFIDPKRGISYLQAANAAAQESDDQVLKLNIQFNLGLLECMIGDQLTGISRIERARNSLQDLGGTGEPGFAQTRSRSAWNPGSLLPLASSTLALWQAATGRFQDALVNAELVIGRTAIEAQEPMDTVAAMATDLDDPGDGFFALALAYAGLGDTDRAIWSFESALSLNRFRDYHPLAILVDCTNLAMCHFPYFTNRLDQRAALIHDLEQRLALLNDSWQESTAWMRDQYLFMTGQWDELRRNAAAVPLESIPVSVYRDLALQTRVQLAWHEGDVQRVMDLIHSMFPGGPVNEPGTHLHVIALDIQRIAARVSIDQEDFEMAAKWLEMHERWVTWSGAHPGIAEGSLLRAELHLARREIDHARNDAALAREQASNPEMPLLLIAINRVLSQISSMAGDQTSAMSFARSAIDLAERCSLPFEIARCKLQFAETQVSGLVATDTDRMLQDAIDQFSSLGAVPLLERARSLQRRMQTGPEGASLGLSRREQDVLRLLIEGLSDREIAERLYISHHTVMRHVTTILRKLDVPSRTAAAALAIRAGFE